MSGGGQGIIQVNLKKVYDKMDQIMFVWKSFGRRGLGQTMMVRQHNITIGSSRRHCEQVIFHRETFLESFGLSFGKTGMGTGLLHYIVQAVTAKVQKSFTVRL